MTPSAPHKTTRKRRIIRGLGGSLFRCKRYIKTRRSLQTMPIYEYACPDCGHLGEHMQKLADAPLTVCPSCGKQNYSKKISAAGFALKGSGWYVTDFRNGSKAPAKSGNNAESTDTSKTDVSASSPQQSGATDNKASASPAPASAPSPTPAPAPTSAPAPAAG